MINRLKNSTPKPVTLASLHKSLNSDKCSYNTTISYQILIERIQHEFKLLIKITIVVLIMIIYTNKVTENHKCITRLLKANSSFTQKRNVFYYINANRNFIQQQISSSCRLKRYVTIPIYSTPLRLKIIKSKVTKLIVCAI